MINVESRTFRVGGQFREVFHRPGTTDRGIIDSIIRDDGEYAIDSFKAAPALRRYAEKLAAGGKVPLIVDAGANVGAASLYLWGQWPTAFVVAVEPERENFQVLLDNISSIRNIYALRMALASKPGWARVVSNGHACGFRATRYDGATQASCATEVACITIDEIVDRSPEAFPLIVKIDIEGAEREVFSDNTEWISKFPLIMCELHDCWDPGQSFSRSFLRCISQHNRDFTIRGETVFSWSNDLLEYA